MYTGAHRARRLSRSTAQNGRNQRSNSRSHSRLLTSEPALQDSHRQNRIWRSSASLKRHCLSCRWSPEMHDERSKQAANEPTVERIRVKCQGITARQGCRHVCPANCRDYCRHKRHSDSDRNRTISKPAAD